MVNLVDVTGTVVVVKLIGSSVVVISGSSKAGVSNSSAEKSSVWRFRLADGKNWFWTEAPTQMMVRDWYEFRPELHLVEHADHGSERHLEIRMNDLD